MSPSLYGGQGGKYLGLIQFSPENQQKYGVHDKQTAPEQMQAVEAYLKDRGLKPGMGLLDTYSTINAGRPGLYNRSDAANGGAPGTVADKVASMAGHRMRANALLGLDPGSAGPAQPGSLAVPQQPTVAPAGGAPMSMAPGGAGVPAGDDALQSAIQGLQAAPAAQQAEAPQQAPQMQLDAIRYFRPNLAKARALAAAMQNRSVG